MIIQAIYMCTIDSSLKKVLYNKVERNTAWKAIFSVSKCSEKIVFPNKSALKCYISCIIRKDGISFPENMILFFRWKMKDDLSQKNTRKYDIFCLSGKDGIHFPYKYDITLLSKKKKKMIFSQKNTLEGEISGICSDRKIKDDIKDFFHKKILMILCTFMENFIGVFIHCFPNRKQEA